MVDYNQKIKELEEELRTTKYNKRTQRAIGLLKAKLARIKERDETRRKGKKRGEGYSVRKSGDASVIMIGFPSSGKSTLLNALTKAKSKIAGYEFTTLNVVPGMLKYKEAQIQILDVPGVLKGAAAGTGRGKEVLAVMQSTDFVMFLIDIQRPGALKVLKKEVGNAHIRVNQTKPDVRIRKTPRGGIRIGKTVKLEMTDDTIKAILKEFKINNADVLIRTKINEDQLIDIIEGNKRYVPGIIVLNKIDAASEKKLQQLKQSLKPDICVSGEKNINIEELKELIFKRLRFIRIYCKQIRKKADLEVPLIMRKGDTIKDMCLKLHKDFLDKFKFARIWGSSAKFDGQKILKTSHKLQDKDIVELHMR